MIKQLLFLFVFLFTLPAFSQAPFVQKRAGLLDQRNLKFREYEADENGFRNLKLKAPDQPSAVGKPSAQPTTVSWNFLCSSMNVEGMLSSSAQPLQYEPTLNAVSFIHRKSSTYTTTLVLSPSAQSGVVVAEISTNWGQSWDSTAVWDDNTNWGRSPQGGIYNPSQNTISVNSFVVATGVTEAANGFSGSFYACKSLNGYSNAGSTAPGAQHFYSFSAGSYPTGQAAHNLSRSSFVATDDGLMRSAGIVQSNYSNIKTIKGFAVATGSLIGNSIAWTVDTLIPPCMTNSMGEKHLLPDPRMAFNQSGTVGYLVGLGVLTNAVNSNKGYQPIIYKIDRTTNANATWTLMPAINFNSPGYVPLVKSTNQGQQGLAGVYISGTDTMGVPFVEDYDIVVDKDNVLHIAATLMSTASNHPDSLHFAAQFTTSVNPTEKYRWRHTPGGRPYLYDFLGKGTSSWTVFTIDSISSESPGSDYGTPGYFENPWDSVGPSGFKPAIGSRIQLGRTPSGYDIIYSWAESDSAITNSQFKWNTFPNIKVRMITLNVPMGNGIYYINNSYEQSITSGHPKVFTRGTLHFMSPVSSTVAATITGVGTIAREVRMPFTVTNSGPYEQNGDNSTWYGDAMLSFSFSYILMCSGPTDYTSTIVGLTENKNQPQFILHPNPAKDEVFLSVEADDGGGIGMQISNGLGQHIVSYRHELFQGHNSVKINVANLPAGIYFITMDVDGMRTTKKFLKE